MHHITVVCDIVLYPFYQILYFTPFIKFDFDRIIDNLYNGDGAYQVSRLVAVRNYNSGFPDLVHPMGS